MPPFRKYCSKECALEAKREKDIERVKEARKITKEEKKHGDFLRQIVKEKGVEEILKIKSEMKRFREQWRLETKNPFIYVSSSTGNYKSEEEIEEQKIRAIVRDELKRLIENDTKF